MKERQLQVVQLACFYFCIQKTYLHQENLSYSPICLYAFWKDPQEITKRQLPEGPGDVFYLYFICTVIFFEWGARFNLSSKITFKEQ